MENKKYAYLFPPATPPLELVCTGYGFEHTTPEMTWGPAQRDVYVVHYVFSGKGLLQMSGGTHQVTGGQMFLIPPNTRAIYTADKEQPWFYCFANFRASASPFPKNKVVFSDSRIGEVFQNILLLAKNEVTTPFAIDAELYRLFSIVTTDVEPRTRQQQYVDNARSFIHEFYSRQIRVADLASYINIERGYLYSLFRQYLGVSPKEYLTNYRLNIAASLLSTGTAVKEVALACGYMDIYSFSKAFKKRFGCSPSTYAQKADKDGEDGGAALPAAEEGGENDGT